MSGIFMMFTWGISIILAILATFSLKSSRVLGILLGIILAQAFMFIGAHKLRLAFGPLINFSGTKSYIWVDLVLAFLGSYIGAIIARRRPV